jgi:hypothetical protein
MLECPGLCPLKPWVLSNVGKVSGLQALVLMDLTALAALRVGRLTALVVLALSVPGLKMWRFVVIILNCRLRILRW